MPSHIYSYTICAIPHTNSVCIDPPKRTPELPPHTLKALPPALIVITPFRNSVFGTRPNLPLLPAGTPTASRSRFAPDVRTIPRRTPSSYPRRPMDQDPTTSGRIRGRCRAQVTTGTGGIGGKS